MRQLSRTIKLEGEQRKREGVAARLARKRARHEGVKTMEAELNRDPSRLPDSPSLTTLHCQPR
jgi:hypothetical protein